MIEHSEAYASAVVADTRRTYLRAEVLIVSPLLAYGEPSGDFAASYAKPEQLYDRKFSGGDKYATLELNRTLLDGKMKIMPDDAVDMSGQIGVVSGKISDEDGSFSEPWTVELPISGVAALQACTIWFAGEEMNGLPVDFTVQILAADGSVGHTEAFTNYRSKVVVFTRFTVYNPSAIVLNVLRWSLPYTRARVMEIFPGLYELWDHRMFQAITLNQQADFSNLVMPYGTCTMLIDNSDKRFQPEAKNNMFASIEEGQSINTSIGVQLADGSVEYIPTGRYYQADGGWTTGNNSLTMQWDLIDIVGLVADRVFAVPATLPTTLDGWISAAMRSVGDDFTKLYVIADGYADAAVTARSAEDIIDLTAGDIIRYACMMAGCYCHADNATGKLIVEPVGGTGTILTLGNMTSYPNIRANERMGKLTFVLADGSNSEIVIDGDSAAASNATTITNPFIRTAVQARAVAQNIFTSYGGNVYETTGRGNPASEVGDIDEIQLSRDVTVKGRRKSQTLAFQNGVMTGCTATFLKISAP